MEIIDVIHKDYCSFVSEDIWICNVREKVHSSVQR